MMDGEIFKIISDNFGIIFACVMLFIMTVFAVKFDLNKYLESRKKKHLSIAQNLCLHMEPFVDGENVGFKPFLFSPSGTTAYYCQRCGSCFMYVDEKDLKRQMEYYAEHPKEYRKRLKKYNKHIKKAQ